MQNITQKLRQAKVRNTIIATVAGIIVLVSGYIIYSSNAATTSNRNCSISEKLVNSCRPWLGAAANKYPGVAEGDYKNQILAHEKAIGHQVDIAHTYHSVGSNSLSAGDKYFIDRAGTYLFTNWKPAQKWADAGGSNSSVNAQIDQMANSIRTVAPKKVFLTINHEPENDVSGGGQGCNVSYVGNAGTPAQYRAMWANVRKRFDAAGAVNVVWVMDYMNFSKWDCLVDDLYPGNDLVDWVMFNAYAYGTGGASDATKNIRHFTDLMAKYQDTSHNFSGKPWGIVEWNVHDMPATTAYKYYDDMKAIANNNTFPNIKAYMVFDSIGPDGNDNRIAYIKPDSAAAKYDSTKLDHYKQLANSAAFNGAATPTPTPNPTPTPAPRDSQAPTVPTGLQVTGQSQNSASFKWNASTDNVAVAGYRIKRGGTELAKVQTTSFTDTGLAANTTYSYTIEAFDAAGNFSAAAPLSVKTQAAVDTTIPTTPSNLAAQIIGKQVNLTWGASADNVGVKEYFVYRDGTKLASSATTNFGDATVAAGKTYTYAVAARDAAGNMSSQSNAVRVSIPEVVTGVAHQPGLVATYFPNKELSGKGVTRADSTVNFDWGNGSPVQGIPTDNFSARWTGRIKAPATGTYTFFTQADDGVRLWVDGRQVVDDWNPHAVREQSGTVQLVKGQWYNIKLEYFEAGGLATAKLLWAGPGTDKQIVPSSAMVTSSFGLNGDYFSTDSLTNLAASRLDSQVNFDWDAEPFAGLPSDHFSVRWTGQVVPDATGTYTFYTLGNDGVRLTVNGKMLVDDWNSHGSEEHSGTIALTAGTKYRITMEYFDNTGHATAHLLWSGAGHAKQLVPQNNLLDR